MATTTSQGSSRFAGIKKKSIQPELDVHGKVKQVKHMVNAYVVGFDLLKFLCVFVYNFAS